MGAVLLAAGVVVYNNVANRWPPFHGWAYVPANLTFAVLIVALGALALDLERTTMGLVWRDALTGLLLGLAAMVPVYALLLRERTRSWLRDRRLAGTTGARAAFMVLVRIPVGTALVEEVVFRGVLIGAFLGWGEAQALVASAAAFGLWHIVPTQDLARANRMRAAIVPLGVAGTALAGLALGWLRLRTGSVAAPFALHATVNSLSAGAALIALRSKAR